MQLEGSQTERNLRNLLAGELQAYFKYTRMAQVAKEAGQQPVADIFAATAQNEMEHAIHCFRLQGGLKDIQSSLKAAIRQEHEEAVNIYPEAAKIAEKEGFAKIADFFRKMGKTENTHEDHFARILETLESGGQIKGRTVGHSATYMAQIMLPNQTNPAGNVHGGELMKMMDNAAGVAAARHCNNPVVTAKVDDLQFLVPVKVGDVVILHSRLVFASRSSMTVRVEVEVEKLYTEKRIHALTASFIMVALNKDGGAIEVPPLIISTEEERILFEEAKAEYEARRAGAVPKKEAARG
ncbi:MAG: hotdog domain-containing protein [Dehalococcoidia bacterium]|nr:hotdog domain-containing protein [Dehalococcoidia bacterium]